MQSRSRICDQFISFHTSKHVQNFIVYYSIVTTESKHSFVVIENVIRVLPEKSCVPLKNERKKSCLKLNLNNFL